MGYSYHLYFQVRPELYVAAEMILLAKLTKASVGVQTILLTVLGFVVGLALSFRSSTAYERFVLRL